MVSKSLVAIAVVGVLTTLAVQFQVIQTAPTSHAQDTFIPFVEKAAVGLPESDLSSDPVLLRASEGGSYKFKNILGRKNKWTVFRPKQDYGTEKDVIVLSGHDDYIRRANTTITEQRVYVVLRRKPDAVDFYHVFYAYVRDLFDGEPPDGSVEINGLKRRIEFDIWDRRGADNNLETRFGWSVCAKSFTVSCDENIDPYTTVSYQEGSEPDYPDELAEATTVTPGEHAVTTDESAEGEEPPSVVWQHDFFTDLTDEFMHSWFLGSTIAVITNAKIGIIAPVSSKDVSQLSDPPPPVQLPAEVKPKRSPQYTQEQLIQIQMMQKTQSQGQGQQMQQQGQWQGQQQQGFGNAAQLKEEMKKCTKHLSEEQGDRTADPIKRAMSGIQGSLTNLMGDGTEQARMREGSDGRGIYGDRDNAGPSVLQPIDQMSWMVGNILGKHPSVTVNKTDPSSRFMNTGTGVAGAYWGFMDGVEDQISQGLGMGRVSNDRSSLDGLADDVLPGVFSFASLPFDVADVVAKPLGLSKPLGFLASLAGMAWASLTPIVTPVKLGVDVIKFGAKALGMKELIGMHGPSDKSGALYCQQFLGVLKRAVDRQNSKPPGSTAQSGRSFGSKAVKFSLMGQVNGLNPDDKLIVDLYTPLGWRGLFAHGKEPFVGFGTCIVDRNITLHDLESSNTPEKLANFYLTTLRTACNPKQVDQLLNLVKEKHIIHNLADHTFSLNPASELVKKPKLCPKEQSLLSLAFEISVYSKVYSDELRRNSETSATLPDGMKDSRSIKTLTKMAFLVLSNAIRQVPFHAIKLVRNLLVTLKTALNKLLQNWHILMMCQVCDPVERLELGADIIGIISLTDFVVSRFEPETKKVADGGFETAYKKYYYTHIQTSSNRFGDYILPTYGYKPGL